MAKLQLALMLAFAVGISAVRPPEITFTDHDDSKCTIVKEGTIISSKDCELHATDSSLGDRVAVVETQLADLVGRVEKLETAGPATPTAPRVTLDSEPSDGVITAQYMTDLCQHWKDQGSSVMTVPEGLKEWPDNLFYYKPDVCVGFDEWRLPASLTKIGDNAMKSNHESFRGNNGKSSVPLRKISFAEGSELTHIGKMCFEELWHLEELTGIPWDKVTTLKQRAFRACKNLKSVGSFAKSPLTAFEPMIFETCSSLKLDDLPPNLATIGSDCFEGMGSCSHWGGQIKSTCVVVTEFPALPVSVTEIQQEAFRDTKFTELCVPNPHVTYGDRVFVQSSIGDNYGANVASCP